MLSQALRRHLLALLVSAAGALFSSPARPCTTSVPDSLYDAHHPSLLFTAADLPALRAKLLDGGPDDSAYSLIKGLVQENYPTYPPANYTGVWYGMEVVPNLGLVAFVEEPKDSSAIDIGRWLTGYVAETYDVDNNEADSGMRLRTLALGYDLFYHDAPDSERCVIRDEMVSYMSWMTTKLVYELFEYPPYLANHSAMFGAALGLAAIALWHEADSGLTSEALAMADRICRGLIDRMIDEGGSYYEGGLYSMWTMKQLVYYFQARKLFDGYDYSTEPRVRAMEQWLAYELLPEWGARTLNLNDSMYHSRPFSLMPTYLDYATSEWQSGLSAWLWDHIAGPYGWDQGQQADKAGTVLWHSNVAPVHPSSVLPLSRLFPGRGLYHFRTGWQTGALSDDVVFVFYSGKYEGGHAQEDQNQIILHGYMEQFVVDHGSGTTAKESESHNMVFVDGAGQHNAGSSIGTDGRIAAHLLTPFGNYLMGDATQAYNTYSIYNNPDRPVKDIDWSWGYHGANPVEYAHRHVLAVGDGTEPPYFVIMDDIRKDGQPHSYEWRLHTASTHTVDTSGNPIVVTASLGASMRVFIMRPDTSAVSVSTSYYDNGSPEPDATLIEIAYTGIEPEFVMLLLPLPIGMSPPAVTTSAPAWGVACAIDWGDGTLDYFLRNDSGAVVMLGPVETDARIAVVRTGGGVPSYLVTEATTLTIDGVLYGEINDDRSGFALVGQTLFLDRYDADFRFLDTGATELRYHAQTLGFVSDGQGYLVSDGVTAAPNPTPAPRPLALSAHPNPFNPTATIRLTAPAPSRVEVEIFNAAGQLIRRLWSGYVGDGETILTWDGTNDAGTPVASGPYFVVARTPAERFVTKLTLLK